ncbi:MAG: hypothetical protein R3F65_05145 [bacterium]
MQLGVDAVGVAGADADGGAVDDELVAFGAAGEVADDAALGVDDAGDDVGDGRGEERAAEPGAGGGAGGAGFAGRAG